jgi:hypothetical protein
MALPATGWGQQVNYRALLIGVSEYPNLERRLWLDGPRNDVIRMREVLQSRGVQAKDITVLADGVPGAELPTRQRIMQELERLATTAKREDYIIIHMGGHGSQQPVPVNSPHLAEEADGLFEVFLPRDVEGWGNKASGSEGDIRNAIIDYEIRAIVDRITARGAFVWGIFDSCHSATLVRSAGNPEVKLRQVTPTELGADPAVIERAAGRAAAARASLGAAATAPRQRAAVAGAGGSVFFYAAQTSEPTPEMRLPAGAPDRRSHGLFSFTILQALEGGAGMSYQQLAQQVLTRYGGMSEARATPLFTGTALQAGLLGQPADNARQWAVIDGEPMSMRAGQLAGVEEGSILAILPSPVARTEQAIGYVQVIRSAATGSQLAPVAFGDVPEKPVAQLKAGRIARMVQPAVKFEFLVGVDLANCGKPCAFEPALARIKASGPNPVPGAQVKWVDGTQASNVRLVAEGNKLWLMPPSMAVGQDCAKGSESERAACRSKLQGSMVYIEAASSATTDGVAASLKTALHKASRASNLMRVATALSTTRTASQLRMALRHVPQGGPEATITGAEMKKLRPGDRVLVSFENTGNTALDVTLLYLDSKYGVDVMYPNAPGASNRVEPGGRSAPVELEITDTSFGTERLAVIAVEASRHGDRADYSFLAQESLANESVTRGAGTRGPGGGDQLFRDAGFAEFTTRGARPAAPSATTGMQVFSWQIVPR